MSSVSAFNGTVNIEQIYNGALSETAAEALSEGIEDGAVPEPGTWALFLAAGAVLAIIQARRLRA